MMKSSRSHSLRTYLRRLAAVIPCLVVSACEINSNNTKIQYMPDMADGPTIKAQESFIDPPPGSVASNALLYPESVQEAEKVLKNPFEATPENTAAGKELFLTFCLPCHGANADGKHALGPTYPPPPDLTNEAYKDKQSGFYFYIMTFGGALMPSYGDKVDVNERWKIARYLESLHSGQ